MFIWNSTESTWLEKLNWILTRIHSNESFHSNSEPTCISAFSYPTLNLMLNLIRFLTAQLSPTEVSVSVSFFWNPAHHFVFCLCLTTLWFAINVPHSLHLFLQFPYASYQAFSSSLKQVWFPFQTSELCDYCPGSVLMGSASLWLSRENIKRETD